jgi:uncharacterized hydrophobic protein (TIGR00271 family)
MFQLIQKFFRKLKSFVSIIFLLTQKTFRKLKSLRKKHLTNEVFHTQVLSGIRRKGRLTHRYIFMMIASTSIATIGLITNSVIIVVGAMLISPMMNPIMLFGFSLCTLNYDQLKISAKSIVYGIIIAVTTSFLITKISPIHQITEQVTSRTHTDLYNLLIAVFSGAAGVYTIIKRKGEEIIGVALATSILPPLAVVGFGLALENYEIARGAGFLFTTNLLAIAISATILAIWYDFGPNNTTSQTLWQIFTTIVIFVILSIPLGITLTGIASQIQVENLTRSKINRYFKEYTDLNFVKIKFPKKDRIDVRAVVYTHLYKGAAQEEITHSLEAALNKKVLLVLEQILFRDNLHEKAFLHRANSEKDITTLIKNEVQFPIQYISIDRVNSIATIYPAHHKNVNAKYLYESQKIISSKFPGWSIQIHPHVVQIPIIYFMVNKTSLSKEEEEKLEIVTWILKSWGVYEVTVTGFVDFLDESTKLKQTSIIEKRINYVIKKLKDNSITAVSMVAHQPTSQKSSYGITDSQKIQIVPQGKALDAM